MMDFETWKKLDLPTALDEFMKEVLASGSDDDIDFEEWWAKARIVQLAIKNGWIP